MYNSNFRSIIQIKQKQISLWNFIHNLSSSPRWILCFSSKRGIEIDHHRQNISHMTMQPSKKQLRWQMAMVQDSVLFMQAFISEITRQQRYEANKSYVTPSAVQVKINVSDFIKHSVCLYRTHLHLFQLWVWLKSSRFENSI